jgi:hypothetical protein
MPRIDADSLGEVADSVNSVGVGVVAVSDRDIPDRRVGTSPIARCGKQVVPVHGNLEIQAVSGGESRRGSHRRYDAQPNRQNSPPSTTRTLTADPFAGQRVGSP